MLVKVAGLQKDLISIYFQNHDFKKEIYTICMKRKRE